MFSKKSLSTLLHFFFFLCVAYPASKDTSGNEERRSQKRKSSLSKTGNRNLSGSNALLLAFTHSLSLPQKLLEMKKNIFGLEAKCRGKLLRQNDWEVVVDSAGRAVASYFRGLQFKSCHRQVLF